MRPTRVCIYGGPDLEHTDLKGAAARTFVETLAYRLLDSMPAVIVTGGFLHLVGGHTISTDFAALEGARRFAKDRGASLKDCFEAWIPEPGLDERNDLGGPVERMGESHGITLRIMTGRTPLGRRLAMVALEDILGVVDQINIPGTVDQYPNWRKRMPFSLEELKANRMLKLVADIFAQAGRASST